MEHVMNTDLLLTLGVILAAAIFAYRAMRKSLRGGCGCGCTGCGASSSCSGFGQIAKRS